MPFIGTQPDVGGYSVLDNLTATATASYTLQKDSANFVPSSANQLLVSLNGVIQKPGSSFTVSGSTLTFSSALTSSDSIDFILAMGEPLLVGTPSDGTVNADKLASNAVTSAKIASSAVTDAKIAGMTATKLTGTVASARFPAGTILQVLQQEFSSDIALTNNLTTFSNAGSLSITPRATSSKIFVFCTCSGDVQTGNHRAIYWDVIRSIDGGTAATIERTQYHMYDSNQQQHNININPLQFLDSPNTTCNCNYTLRGRHQSGSSESGTYNGYINRYNESHMTLMEVAG